MNRLEVYLALERVMLALDDKGDELADRVRDLMDPVWYELSDEEAAALDSRGVVDPGRLNPIRLALGDSVFYEPAPAGASGAVERRGEVGWRATSDDWTRAA